MWLIEIRVVFEINAGDVAKVEELKINRNKSCIWNTIRLSASMYISLINRNKSCIWKIFIDSI